jgi:hypothetical protein
MTIRSLGRQVRKLSEAADAIFCPHCHRLVRPIPDLEALPAVVIARLIADAEPEVERDNARLRELGVEDADRLLLHATAEEVRPMLPFFTVIRKRISAKDEQCITCQ